MAVRKGAQATGRAKLVPDLKPGKYSDGLPLNEVKYLECKIILQPNHFKSRENLFDFGKLMRRPAKESGVDLDTKGFADEPLQIREVLFLDTPDFRLYNNAFILRRRIPYKDGFPTGDPEIVLKYRHPDLQKTAEMDVRPRINGDYQIKFKAEALPLKDGLGGIRMLYSHNVEFGLSSVREGDRTSMETIVRTLPVLESIRMPRGERIELVSGTIVEEVLQDIGVLDFGNGMTAVANVALWRNRGDHSPLIGEFAFQIKFKRREELNEKALTRGKAFFISLQNAAKDWIALGATKTGVVYRLKGNPPHAHE
jgi:hypothetical protein